MSGDILVKYLCFMLFTVFGFPIVDALLSMYPHSLGLMHFSLSTS